MPCITSAERIGMEEGLKQGMQQGMQKGIQQVTRIILELNKHFTTGTPTKILNRLEKSTPDELEQWLIKISEEKFEIEEI